jgi:hypothetical protein
MKKPMKNKRMMFPRLHKLLQAQRGAMFGMDARIALIIAAILAAAGGVTYMSRLERSKVEQAEDASQKLREALLKYYQTVSINRMPATLEEVFAANLVDDPSMRKDPWGNPWYFQSFPASVTLGGTPVTVYHAVIYSAGKDGVDNSPGITSESDYAQWQPLRDDVGIKVSTRDIEMKRNDDYAQQGQLIVKKLEDAENAAYLEAQGTCGGETPPEWCTNSSGKNYTQFNYYPTSNLDDNADAVRYPSTILNKPVYNSGDENDMQQLMLDLGLPTTFAKDPWGRTLRYHSNASSRADPPFAASICFSFGEDCFVER